MSALADLINLDLSDSTDQIIAEYIWIGGSGLDMRSKARTLSGPVKDPSELPKWNYDGSSTGQAPGDDSEVILYPQAIFKDPFRRGNNILVMCDAYTPAGEPIPTNKRHAAAKIFSDPNVVAEVTWYGIEQEYTLLQKDIKWPVGWPVGGFPGPQGPYYCGVGADKAFGRDIVDSHYKACLYAGINVSGTNGEVMPGQWEFQVGPTVGIAAADQVWVARYILERITELAGVVLSLDPKPIPGDWNGAGAHTNYRSQEAMERGQDVENWWCDEPEVAGAIEAWEAVSAEQTKGQDHDREEGTVASRRELVRVVGIADSGEHHDPELHKFDTFQGMGVMEENFHEKSCSHHGKTAKTA
ncbi:PREDICTED: glutamine synthetase cytosolic isozyme 1-4 isoform X2 [Camelina sativa]|uniref:glutamine synthetase n=1 Tax=Camelina sativa TaxID=90675 RepID=A0ABM0T3I2_CAMSA|nr:PREDICTED: glutamine synthetase cytosolic isozyme 1-4 isoform X2 [Camelina sativa]